MTESRLETFLARIYTNEGERRRFLADPESVATSAGLDPDEIEAVVNIDKIGLELFANSLERKRQKQASAQR